MPNFAKMALSRLIRGDNGNRSFSIERSSNLISRSALVIGKIERHSGIMSRAKRRGGESRVNRWLMWPTRTSAYGPRDWVPP